VRGKVGAAAGPLTAEAEAGKSASSTSSFSRPDFSSERKGIEVINYLIEHNTPQYYKTREEWLLRRANADFWIEWQQSQLFPKLINSSAVDRIAPLTGKVSKEEREDIERKAERYEAYLMDGLRSSGFVVVDGTFSVHAVGNNINLLEHFSAKPTVVFRAELPKSAMDGVLREGRTHLTMFGNVIKTLDNEGYVDLRPIALY
jgi:hypothetical protein